MILLGNRLLRGGISKFTVGIRSIFLKKMVSPMEGSGRVLSTKVIYLINTFQYVCAYLSPSLVSMDGNNLSVKLTKLNRNLSTKYLRIWGKTYK